MWCTSRNGSPVGVWNSGTMWPNGGAAIPKRPKVPKKRSLNELTSVAYHEAGHAGVGYKQAIEPKAVRQALANGL